MESTRDVPSGFVGAPKLLEHVRAQLRARYYSPRTEKAYTGWIRRFIFFHRLRHPNAMGQREVGAFLSSLAIEHNVAASTQNQACSALMFLYSVVLRKDLSGLDQIPRARRPARLPLVLSRAEVRAVLGQLRSAPWLMAGLLYGSGLRVSECAELRVKDLDFDRREITVRDGKGRRDRRTMLPGTAFSPLKDHLAGVKQLHERDLASGAGHVVLPDRLARKYRHAAAEWAWQWVFPATRPYWDRRSGERRRHHLHQTVLQRAFRVAVRRAGISKPASCHSLRHSFACTAPSSLDTG